MSTPTIRRIKFNLEKQFAGKIDMSDWATRPEHDRNIAFLSRALAALCIKSLASCSADTAARAVTDGFGDGGIDALHFDQNSDKFFLVQTKWNEDGSTPIKSSASGNFKNGVNDLLNGRIDRFNDKIKSKEAEIRAAIYSTSDVKIVLVTAHTSIQKTPLQAKRIIDDYVLELNNPVPIAIAENFDQASVYRLVTSESEPVSISLPIHLRDWGTIDKPFLAYYGRVHVDEIAGWWSEHSDSLFYRNLRHFFHSSDVNDALKRTLEEAPENFWYFNNGITIICNSLSKAIAGGPGRDLGLFNCDGVSVVNGAQTVGTIGSAKSIKSIDENENSNQAWVQIRIISLDDCPPGFDQQITRATNFQNAVTRRDFAAMDPIQHRLATEFALDRRKYIYKSGESDPRGEEGCSIIEATQALACAFSIGLSVQVKREIGELWDRTDAPPYTDLFNDDLSATRLWRSVLVMRAVDDELQKLRRSTSPRADMLGVHMNRVILHLVFRSDELSPLKHDRADETRLITAARNSANEIFPAVAEYIQREHEEEYLASLCKNSAKCETLVRTMLEPANFARQADLFR